MIAIIQTAIAIVVIYILFSIINSILVEAIARWVKMRSKYLKNSLFELFEDIEQMKVASAVAFVPKLALEAKPEKTSFTEKILDTSWVEKWKIFNKGKIEKIEPVVFAEAMVEAMLSGNQSDKIDLKKLKELINEQPIPVKIKEGFQSLLLQIDEDKDNVVEKFKEFVETWYAHFAERLKASYKNHIRKYLFISGLLMAMAFNVDSIYLTQYFHKNPQARESYVMLGKELAKDSIKIDTNALISFVLTNKDSLSANQLIQNILTNATTSSDSTVQFSEVSALPFSVFNWSKHRMMKADGKPFPSVLKWLGIFLTGLALSFGSPYWFDVLRKLVKLDT